MPDDAASPGFATGPVGRDVDAGPVRPSGHRVPRERERGLVAEELVLSHTRYVGTAELANLRIGQHRVPSANAVERVTEVATAEPTVADSDLGCARHAERGGKHVGELGGPFHAPRLARRPTVLARSASHCGELTQRRPLCRADHVPEKVGLRPERDRNGDMLWWLGRGRAGRRGTPGGADGTCAGGASDQPKRAAASS